MTRRAGFTTEHIDAGLQNVIFNRVNEKIRKEEELGVTTKDKYARYLGKYSRVKANKLAMAKPIHYDSLPAILSVADMSIYDLYAEVGIPVTWRNADEEELASICSRLSKKDLEKCYDLAMELSPDFWQTDEDYINGCPSARVMYLMRRRFNDIEKMRIRRSVDPLLSEFWLKDKHRNGGYTAIPTANLPSVARELGVTLHWLMKQDTAGAGSRDVKSDDNWDVDKQAATVLAQSYDIEMVLTAYCFMPDSVKNGFLNAMRIIENEGCENS